MKAFFCYPSPGPAPDSFKIQFPFSWGGTVLVLKVGWGGTQLWFSPLPDFEIATTAL